MILESDPEPARGDVLLRDERRGGVFSQFLRGRGGGGKGNGGERATAAGDVVERVCGKGRGERGRGGWLRAADGDGADVAAFL